MAVSDYDAIAGNNTSINGVDISEGCSPAGINNAIRQMMADLATFQGTTIPAQYVSATNDDTMAGQLIIDRSSGDEHLRIGGTRSTPLVAFHDDTDTRVAFVQVAGGLRIAAENGATDYILQLGDDGTLSWRGSTVWTAGTDGPGSGLDADTIDGVQLSGLAQIENAFTAFTAATSPGLAGLLTGTTEGKLFNGPVNQQVVVGVKGNDGNDGFHVADTNGTGDTGYARLVFTVCGNRIEYLGNAVVHTGLSYDDVGAITYAQNVSGGVINADATVAASSIQYGTTTYTGNWKAMANVNNGAFNIFRKVS